MKLTLLLMASLLFLAVVTSYGQDGKNRNTQIEDSIINKIDSIVEFIDSKLPAAEDQMPSAPNGLFAIYRADTLKGELRKAQQHSEDGDIFYLYTYYYLNNKLIKAREWRYNTKRKKDKKTNDYERICYYWNNSLYSTYNRTKETFDINFDLNNSQRVLKRFQEKYSSNQLNFKLPLNISN